MTKLRIWARPAHWRQILSAGCSTRAPSTAGRCSAARPSAPALSLPVPSEFTPLTETVMWFHGPELLAKFGCCQAHCWMSMTFKNCFLVFQVKNNLPSQNWNHIYLQRKTKDFFFLKGWQGLGGTEGWEEALGPRLLLSWIFLPFKRPSLHVNLVSKSLRPCLYLLRVLLTAWLLGKHYSCPITVSEGMFAVRKATLILQLHNIKVWMATTPRRMDSSFTGYTSTSFAVWLHYISIILKLSPGPGFLPHPIQRMKKKIKNRRDNMMPN